MMMNNWVKSCRHLRAVLRHDSFCQGSSLFFRQNRHLSRSISNVFKKTSETDVSQIKPASPLLIESVQKRLSALTQEVDLGLGPVVAQSNDLLEEALIKAITIEQVNELIRVNFRSMNAAHISTCFQTIDNIVKYSDNDDALVLNILGSKEFLMLSNRALKLARHLEASDALKSLLAVRRLGVSMNTLLVQSLLQMVRFSINEYSIDELHQLTNLLVVSRKRGPSIQSSTLADAITLALPYALKNRVNNKEMDFSNPQCLLRCLEIIATFGSDHFADVEALHKILHSVNESTSKLNLRQCIQLLSHIYSLNLDADADCLLLSKSIASKCIERLLEADHHELGQLPGSILVNVLKKMRRNHRFYDAQLFRFINAFALSSNTEQNNFSAHDRYFIALQNWNFKFVDYKLLSYFAGLIEARDPVVFNPTSSISASNLLRFFTSSADCHQIHSNFPLVCENIRTSSAFEAETSKSRMAYFHYLKNCLLLGVHLEEGILKQWLSKYLQSAFEECNSTSKRHLFLKTVSFIYQGLLLDRHHPVSSETRHLIESKLKPFIEEYIYLLLNEQMATSQANPILEELHFIAARQIDPSQLTKNFITPFGLVVDLLVRTNHRPVGFVLMSRRNYCREPAVLDGDSQFQLAMLRKSDILPVVVNCERWGAMGDAEKELYISNEINSAQ